MATNFKAPGNVIQYTNGTGSDIASGEVVEIASGYFGVALTAIANGATGSVAIDGVFNVPKGTAAAVTQGNQPKFSAAKAVVPSTATAGTTMANVRIAEGAAQAATTCDIVISKA